MCHSAENIMVPHILKLQKWRQSDAYLALCQALYNEAAEIRQYGLDHINDDTQLQVVRTEIGSKSDLHRGVYCPSPVYDIFVGNVKRGKLLKRLTKQSTNYYIYGFDKAGKLVRAEQYRNGEQSTVEHISHTDSSIYGITHNQHGGLSQVTHETYVGNKLVTYSKILLLHYNSVCEIMDLRKEQYIYDESGLSHCCFIQYVPKANLCQQTLYQFQRKNGKLARYTASDVIGREPYEKLNTSAVYEVFIDRNA